MKRSPLFAGAGILAVALATTGCTAGGAPSDGPVELTFWHGYTEADGDVQAIFDLPLLTPGTYARAYVFQKADDSVAVLVQLRSSIVIVPAR